MNSSSPANGSRQGRENFREIEHTADYAIRVDGGDLTGLFASAARGMICLMGLDPQALSRQVRRDFTLTAMDAESLLVEWLSEIAYWAEMEMLIFHHFEFGEVSDTLLSVSAAGCRVAALEKHIKAVTYHNLEIIRTEAGLSATVVFDV